MTALLLSRETASAFIRVARMFLSTDLVFEKNGLDKLSWTSFISDLLLRIIITGVPGLATDCPCGVWDHGWTIYFLYDGPLLGLCF